MKATKQINEMGYYRLVTCSGVANIEKINNEFTCILFRDRQKAKNYLAERYGIQNVIVAELED